MPGALEFARHAEQRGVRIFYVTNRRASNEPWTRDNLAARGFPVDPDGGNVLSLDEEPGWGSDKLTRRAHVARGHRVLLIVGDDLNDFVSGARADPEARAVLARRHPTWWGTKWIVLPNPMYGSWEHSLYRFEPGLSPEEIRRRKHEALETLE